jgi:hypothetical protein
MKKKIETPTPIGQRPENDPYPTNTELRIIQRWNILKYTIPDLVEYVKAVWWYPERQFELRKGRDHLRRRACMKLELHTGGWSGNESVICALRRNYLFWSMFWRKTYAGGHYYFEIRMTEWNRNLTKEEHAKLEATTDRILNKGRE